MARKDMKGVYPILPAPFDRKGNLVTEDLARLVDWSVKKGVHGLGIAFASEIYKLNESDRDLFLKTVVKASEGRANVVMNTTAEGTDLAVQLAKRAEELGADALMVRPPVYGAWPGPTLIDHFVSVGEAVNIPVFLQDQPGAAVPPAMAVELARRNENLRFIKVENPPTVPGVANTAAAARAARVDMVIHGGYWGYFFIEELRRGAVGTMPDTTMADVFVRMWNKWQAGKQTEAETEFRKYEPLLRVVGQGQGLCDWLSKHVMYRRGAFSKGSTYARRPSLAPDKTQLKELDRLIEELGLGA